MATSKLILSVEDARDHDKWLKVRNQGIGGSDAGAILGLNPYRSPLAVWAEKVNCTQPPDLSNNEAVKAGILLEPVVAKWFEDETGKKVTRRGTLQNIAHPFMLANVDRMIVGENAGLEIKTAGSWAAKQWVGDEIPDSYYCQCLHYMAVTGCEAWYIAALIGGQKFVWKRIERNSEDINTLIDTEEKFWQHVKDGTPPDYDDTYSCGQALAALYRNHINDGEVLDLNHLGGGKENEVELALQTLHSLSEEEKNLKSRQQFAKNALMAAMGPYETGYFNLPDNTLCKISWKAPKPSEGVKLSDIKKKAPDVYGLLKERGLITTHKTSRVLRIYRHEQED